MVGVLIVGQILEGYVIYPRFLGDRVELPAVWVIFALFAGGAAFGFLGVMLAVPVAATIGVLGRFWLRRYLASPLYLDPPAPDAASGVADGAAQLPLLIPRSRFTTKPASCRRRRTRPRGPGWPAPSCGRTGGWRCGARRTAARRICCGSGLPGPGLRCVDGAALAGFPAIASPAAWRSTTPTGPMRPRLLHLLNTARDLARPVLLAGALPPARWPVRLPDLDSRLRAITAVEVGRRTTSCCADCCCTGWRSGNWSRTRPCTTGCCCACRAVREVLRAAVAG